MVLSHGRQSQVQALSDVPQQSLKIVPRIGLRKVWNQFAVAYPKSPGRNAGAIDGYKTKNAGCKKAGGRTGAGIRADPSNTQCIGQSRKESRKILTGWLQKHRLPTRFCLAFLVHCKTLQAIHNVGLFPPRRCISDVRLFPPRSCNARLFPPGRHRDASSREEAPLP